MDPKNMKKRNSKSIRLSDEILHYIENYEGTGFNEKFENIILFCMRSEADLKNRIEDLEMQINDLNNEKMLLQAEIDQLCNTHSDDLLEISKYLVDKSNQFFKSAHKLKF